MSKNFDETVRLQSKKREERKIREERLQRIAEGASSAPRLASSSAALFSRRNECPGTHCNLIEHEEKKTVPDKSAREFEIKRKDGGRNKMARTKRESDKKRREMAELLVLPRPAKSVQNGAGFSG